MRHMTVGALIAILWDRDIAEKNEKCDFHSDAGHHPLLCGVIWKGNIATQSFHIDKNGEIKEDMFSKNLITCPKCIEVLKNNGL